MSKPNSRYTKTRILNFFLIITSLVGYLEWGGCNHMFLFQGELDILKKLFSDPASVFHPFILLPLAGQIILLATLFQKRPNVWATLSGMLDIGILILLMFFIGCMEMNFKMIVSTVPFIILAIWSIIYLYRKK